MASPIKLSFEANLNTYTVGLFKFDDSVITPTLFRSEAVVFDALQIAPDTTVGQYKAKLERSHISSTGGISGFPAYLHATAKRDFGMGWQHLRDTLKASLTQRYLEAHATIDPARRLAALKPCATEGYIQAAVDIGIIYERSASPECIAWYAEAHRMGHPDGLLLMARFFMRGKSYDQAVRALLAATWCGSVTAPQILLQLSKQSENFDLGRCRAALEEACEYGSVLAMYVLAFQLRHGAEQYRNPKVGLELLERAGALTHHDQGDGRGPVVHVEGVERTVQGSLAHIEHLVDCELLAARIEVRDRLFAGFLAGRKNMRDESDPAAYNAEFFDFMRLTDPTSERMVRKVDGWLNGEDVSETKGAYRA